MENFQASFLPSDGEDLDEVCDVDVFVALKDGSCRTATVFTVAEVERLMKFWTGTEELHSVPPPQKVDRNHNS
ncbi:hypothetical protein [Streptomyces sp. NPDC003522]